MSEIEDNSLITKFQIKSIDILKLFWVEKISLPYYEKI